MHTQLTMRHRTAFERFAPTILEVYHRDREAFWAAVMAPFLADHISIFSQLRHLKVDLGLLYAFRGLDEEARQVLKDFSGRFGLDVSHWKSNRMQYFKDAYPIFAFLAVWMDEEGLTELVGRFSDILRAGVFAVAGYGILDGCNATASILALLPFMRSSLLRDDLPIIVDIKAGSSEGGASPSLASHHPERSGAVRSFGRYPAGCDPAFADYLPGGGGRFRQQRSYRCHRAMAGGNGQSSGCDHCQRSPRDRDGRRGRRVAAVERTGR